MHDIERPFNLLGSYTPVTVLPVIGTLQTHSRNLSCLIHSLDTGGARKPCVIGPLCLVESFTLDAAVRRECSLFTSFTINTLWGDDL